MSTLATDDFNRADSGDIGASWDPCTGEAGPAGFRILSNTAVASGNPNNDCSETNNSVTWPNDQYSKVTFSSPGANGVGVGYGPSVRAATGSTVTYYRAVGNASGYELGKMVTGAFTSLSSSSGTTFVGGDTLELDVIGTAWKVLKNGVQVATGSDSAIASGRAGIAYSSTDGNTRINSWEGGDVATATRGMPFGTRSTALNGGRTFRGPLH